MSTDICEQPKIVKKEVIEMSYVLLPVYHTLHTLPYLADEALN